ncbi:unnamed protein product [Closterium sp. NIES-54]
MEVVRTSMVHVAAPHFLWSFAVRYAAHQLNLWPRVSEPETSPTLRWTGKVGDASVFRFYHPRSQQFFSSQDVTFDESVCYYTLHPHASHPGPAPLGVSQVDLPPLVEPLEVSSDSSGPAEGDDPTADDTAATRRSPRLETLPGFPSRPSSPPPQPAAVDSRAETAGAESGVAEPEGEGSGGATTGGAGFWGAATGGADSGGPVSPSGGGGVGDPAGGPGARQPPQRDLLEMLSPQAIRAWIVRRGSPGGGGYGLAGAGAASPGGTAGAGGTGGTVGAGGATSAGGIRGAAGAGGAGVTSRRGATGAAGVGPTSPGGTASAGGAGGTAGARGAVVGGTGGVGAAGPGGACSGGAGAAGAGDGVRAGGPTGAAGSGGTGGAAGTGGAGAGGTAGAEGAGGATGAAGTGGACAAGAGGTGAAGAGGAGAAGTALRRPFFYPQPHSSLPPPDSSQPQLLPGSPLPVPGPHTEMTESLTERHEPETRASTPVRARRVARPRPPAVPSTHGMALRPSSPPQHVVLPEPLASPLPHVSDPESDLARAVSPTVTCLLATVVTDPDLESTAAFALVTELVDFAARTRLDYVASLVTESEFVCPRSVRGELALGYPDALNIPTPRSYAEAIAGEYSSQWKTAMDVEMASWKSTGTYVDEVPPPGANIFDGMWIFSVKRLPGSLPAFKARYVA